MIDFLLGLFRLPLPGLRLALRLDLILDLFFLPLDLVLGPGAAAADAEVVDGACSTANAGDADGADDDGADAGGGDDALNDDRCVIDAGGDDAVEGGAVLNLTPAGAFLSSSRRTPPLEDPSTYLTKHTAFAVTGNPSSSFPTPSTLRTFTTTRTGPKLF